MTSPGCSTTASARPIGSGPTCCSWCRHPPPASVPRCATACAGPRPRTPPSSLWTSTSTPASTPEAAEPSPTLVVGVPSFDEGGHALLGVGGGHVQVLGDGLVVERRRSIAVERPVDEPLGRHDRTRS